MKNDCVWSIEDAGEMLEALYAAMDERCLYGEELDVLTKPERVFYVARTLLMEINNGGFVQFFVNCPDIAGEAEAAFAAIGAPSVAKLCKKALEAFDASFPEGADAVNGDVLAELYESETGEYLDELDTALLAYEEEIDGLCRAYALANRPDFK